MIPVRTINTPFKKSVNVCNKNGVMKTIRAFNRNAAMVYLLYFDTNQAVNDGAVPSSAPVPLSANNGYYESGEEFHFRSGLSIYASTTPESLTAISSDDVWFHVQVEF